MRRRYDNPSEASSLFLGRQLNSRSSSKTAVSTPLEDFRTSRYIKPEILPQETVDDFLRDTYPEDAFSCRETVGKLARDTNLNLSCDSEPYGPYFSIPPKVQTKPTISRRGTTKELIGRYESLSSKDPHLERKKSSVISRVDNVSPEIKSTEKKGKGRSPIRQSFRNLLSVFSKKGKTTRDASLHVPDLLHTPEEDDVGENSEKLGHAPPVPSKSLSLPQIRMDGTQLVEEPACMTPSPLYSGELHYLCNPTLPDGLPVWINCEVVLHHSHIVITWRSSLGNPSTSIIHLSDCTDVRSLSSNDLNPAEAQLLPLNQGRGDSKVFELLFEGRAREKFAAVSVKERAGWVSAVWSVS